MAEGYVYEVTDKVSDICLSVIVGNSLYICCIFSDIDGFLRYVC